MRVLLDIQREIDQLHQSILKVRDRL